MGTEHLLKQDYDWPHSLPIMFSRQALSLRASARKTVAARSAIQQQTRKLSIHEYLSVKLLNQYGVLTPESKAAHSPEEAYEVAKSFPTNELVIKAQVLAGGRGKGHFDSGLQGGVKMIETLYQRPQRASCAWTPSLALTRTPSSDRRRSLRCATRPRRTPPRSRRPSTD